MRNDAHYDNDNTDPWKTLAAATASAILKISEDDQGPTETERETADRQKKQKEKAHRDFVARRLRDIAAFERRVSGRKDRA